MSPDALRKAFETYSEKVLHLKQSWLLIYMVNQLEWMKLKTFVINGVTLVEDAAESLGAEYHGQKVEHSVNLVSFHLMAIKLSLPVVAVCLFLMIKNISNMPFS